MHATEATLSGAPFGFLQHGFLTISRQQSHALDTRVHTDMHAHTLLYILYTVHTRTAKFLVPAQPSDRFEPSVS